MTNFTFIPRTEAHPMKWDDLLSPLQQAVRDLLLRLDGAVKKVDQDKGNSRKDMWEESSASCFLIYGERGTGKTTVLLSASNAVNKKCDDFFESQSTNNSLRSDAKKSAGELRDKGIVWLDVLDIESMPPKPICSRHCSSVSAMPLIRMDMRRSHATHRFLKKVLTAHDISWTD